MPQKAQGTCQGTQLVSTEPCESLPQPRAHFLGSVLKSQPLRLPEQLVIQTRGGKAKSHPSISSFKQPFSKISPCQLYFSDYKPVSYVIYCQLCDLQVIVCERAKLLHPDAAVPPCLVHLASSLAVSCPMLQPPATWQLPGCLPPPPCLLAAWNDLHFPASALLLQANFRNPLSALYAPPASC